MKTLALTFATIVLVVLALVVLRSMLNGTQFTLAAGAAGAQPGKFAVGAADNFVQGPYTIHGTAIMDTSVGTPAVPYIMYLDTKHATTTKQLVYLDERACAPGAGDAPCVAPYQATDGYPLVTTGESITATGYIYEDRFLVTSISSDGS